LISGKEVVMGWLHGNEDRGGIHACKHGVDVREFCPECERESREATARQAAEYAAEEEARLQEWRKLPLAEKSPIKFVEEFTNFERGLTKKVPLAAFLKQYPGEWRFNAARRVISTPGGYPLDVVIETPPSAASAPVRVIRRSKQ
jgi:hypothetical protein